MATTTGTETQRPKRARPGAWRRYGPLAVVVAIVAVIAIVAVVASGGGNGSSKVRTSGGNGPNVSNDQLFRSGPMTPQKAKLLGQKVDFGPKCDASLGTVRVPSATAPPCVRWPAKGESSDNGGATYAGVTKDEITVVAYVANPANDPLQAALIRQAGAQTDPDSAFRTLQGYVDYFSQHYELYGRKVRLLKYVGTGSALDNEKAKADAIAIAGMNPFAVIGGPAETPAFADELASRHILCIGSCALAEPEGFTVKRSPYIWSTGPSPEQASTMAAEMIGKAFKGDAKYAGDPSMHNKPRVFGVAHYDTPEGQQHESFLRLKSGLEKYGIKLKTDVQFFLEPTRFQENARTVISKLKAAGVTSVIFYGDPFTPQFLTQEATAQSYFPEWIIGPNVLVDSVVFARRYDQRQWAHAFGIKLTPATENQKLGEPYVVYQWQFGKPPPNDNYPVLYPDPANLFLGIHLAGPKLTPDTFRDGMFRAGIRGGGPTTPTVSRGHWGIWPGTDWWGSDDAGVIWWNPAATGEDEIGNPGKGLYENADNGKRYRPGHWPTSTGIFDASTSVTSFQKLLPIDERPKYPSPAK